MKDDTLLAHTGRDPESHQGMVNMPLFRGSTVLFPNFAAFKARAERKAASFSYGIDGTPTTFALAEAMAELEGAARALITSSGLTAITMPLMAFLQQGDHLLVADTVYGPTRNFCNTLLTRFGVETTFYDPLIGAGIADLMRDNTRVVFMESPGTATFEVQDVPAIAKVAREKGAVSMVDNTWASPMFFKPIAHGVDVSIHAATKYISGHSDFLLGTVAVRDEQTFQPIRESRAVFGDCPAPDVIFQALRGLRTLAVRMRHQQQAALKIARWLAERPEVNRVLHPGLAEDPGHALWKRDFTGASGLFGVVLHTTSEDAVAAMLDGLRWFGLGASWGGFESLAIPAWPAVNRTATTWDEPGFVLRISIGLEDPQDLIDDLEAGLERLAKSAG